MHYWENNLLLFWPQKLFYEALPPFPSHEPSHDQSKPRKRKNLDHSSKTGNSSGGKKKETKKNLWGKNCPAHAKRRWYSFISSHDKLQCSLIFLLFLLLLAKNRVAARLAQKSFFFFVLPTEENEIIVFLVLPFSRGNSRECNRRKTDGKGGAE